MNIIEKITEAEFEVLKLLWKNNTALSSAEINQALKQSKGWEKSTIRTLVHRLTEKGALFQQQREMFYYSPIITEKEYLSKQTKNFIERLYGGSAKNLVASLVEQDYIQPEDIEDIKRFWMEGENKNAQ